MQGRRFARKGAYLKLALEGRYALHRGLNRGGLNGTLIVMLSRKSSITSNYMSLNISQ